MQPESITLNRVLKRVLDLQAPQGDRLHVLLIDPISVTARRSCGGHRSPGILEQDIGRIAVYGPDRHPD